MPVIAILLFAKLNANGFNILWRYFAFANQSVAVFAFAMITVYLAKYKKPYLMSLIPGSFYMFIVSSFILNAKIGFNLSWTLAYIIAAALTAAYAVLVARTGIKAQGNTLANGSL